MAVVVDDVVDDDDEDDDDGNLSNSANQANWPQRKLNCIDLRCFDTVFSRPYRYFSIALKVVFSLSDRYKIFTSNWLWIEMCENVVFSKIDITMTTINKKV